MPTVLVVPERLCDLVSRVHNKRAVLHDGLADGRPSDQQEAQLARRWRRCLNVVAWAVIHGSGCGVRAVGKGASLVLWYYYRY